MIADQLIHRFLHIPHKLHVVADHNPKGKPVVVFIHGIGGTGASWHRILPKIEKEARIISVDLLGFGHSPKPEWSKYNAHQHAAALAWTLWALKAYRNIIIVGHSLGSLVAVEYAFRHKRSVKNIILCSPPFYQPPARFPSNDTAKDDAYRKLYKYIRNNPQALLRIGELFNRYSRFNKRFLINADTLPAYIKSLEASIENQDSIEKIKTIKMPIDIIYGKFDVLLIKKNLKLIQESNNHVMLHPVAAGHEVVRLFSTKLVALINRRITYQVTTRPK